MYKSAQSKCNPVNMSALRSKSGLVNGGSVKRVGGSSYQSCLIPSAPKKNLKHIFGAKQWMLLTRTDLSKLSVFSEDFLWNRNNWWWWFNVCPGKRCTTCRWNKLSRKEEEGCRERQNMREIKRRDILRTEGEIFLLQTLTPQLSRQLWGSLNCSHWQSGD